MFWPKKKKLTDQAIAYLKPSFPNDDTPALVLPFPNQPVVSRYSDELCICYVVDQGHSFLYIHNRDLERDGIDKTELHRIGLRNLWEQTGSSRARVQPYKNIFAVFMGGNLEASLILLDELWERDFRQFVQGEYAAAIPARDILSFCDSSSSAGVDELNQLIERVRPTGDHLISEKIYVRRDGRFEPRGG